MAYRNVASKLYNFYPEEIGEAIKDLTSILEKYGYHPTGELFYSMISEPTAEIMTAEIFMPIEEPLLNVPKEEEVSFRSYFLIKNAVSARLLKEFDEQSQVKYWELVSYAEEKNLRRATPFFVEYKRTYRGTFYAVMSFGVEKAAVAIE